MSDTELALINCQIVTPHFTYPAVLYLRQGKIAKIADRLQERPARVLDMGGRYVMPGFIDSHVHMMDPGYPECEDFLAGTRAAARAGVTTILDVPRHIPPVDSAKRVREQRKYLADRALVNYGVFAAVFPSNLDSVEAMWRAGAVGLKVFTVEIHKSPPLTPGDLMKLFRLVSDFNGAVLLHAEDDSLVKANETRLRASGRRDPMVHAEMHSPEAQVLAVDMVCSVAELSLGGGARLVFAHLSDPVCLRRVARARGKGVPIFAETMPHYLYLTYDDLRERGPWVKFAPTVRSAQTVAEMWRCLARGLVHLVSTDHAPQPARLIRPGKEDIWKSPLVTGSNIEVGSRLMLHAVNEGKISLHHVAQVMSAGPAQIYGLYPRKGAIEVGADADLVVVDLEREETIQSGGVLSKGGWTMYDGRILKGAPVMTLVRGRVVYEEGKVTGEPGWGRCVAPQEGREGR
ncbi:MAG: dihydroorotase family protein [Nitrospinota bacterium]